MHGWTTIGTSCAPNSTTVPLRLSLLKTNGRPLWRSIALDAADPIGAFGDAWNLILALDYKPIFETGRAALNSCPNDPAYAAAIRDSARAALAVVRTIAGLRHDLLGRIFHTVLDTARYDGSFYTTTAAATLLATLAIGEDMCDWQDAEAIARLRIIDPACGTGTLLMAAAERIRDLAPQSQDDGSGCGADRTGAQRLRCQPDGHPHGGDHAGLAFAYDPVSQHENWTRLSGRGRDGRGLLGSLEFLERQPWLIPWPKSVQAVSQIETGEEIPQAERPTW